MRRWRTDRRPSLWKLSDALCSAVAGRNPAGLLATDAAAHGDAAPGCSGTSGVGPGYDQHVLAAPAAAPVTRRLKLDPRTTPGGHHRRALVRCGSVPLRSPVRRGPDHYP